MILKQIKREKEKFENEDVKVVEGVDFNQKNTIDRIYRYYNSRFKYGEIDSEGNKKYFFNVVKNPCKVTTKSIDFDLKHIRFMTVAGGDPHNTWLMERDFRFWAKDKGFGNVLNRIFTELPIFGSVVLKLIDGEPHFVDLRNFIVDKAADTLNGANFIIERHLYSPMEFREVAGKMNWDEKMVERAIEEYRKMDTRYISVYERYGELSDESNNYSYKKVFVADVGVDSVDPATGETYPYDGVVLEETEVDSHPYWETHLEKLPGRWMGVGVVESLFDPQVRQNEIANLMAKGSYWNAIKIFNTRDPDFNRNLKTEVKDGEVLRSDDELTQVNIRENNLDFFNLETTKWMKNIDDLTFRYEVTRGERLPSGTPLGSARIAAAMAGAYFDQIRENIALDVKRLLYDHIIPSFKDDMRKEHTLRLVGEDLDQYNELLISQKAWKRELSFLGKKKRAPFSHEQQLMESVIGETVKRGREKLIDVAKGIYDSIKYKIDILITGEQKDTSVYANTLFAALQAVIQRPELLTEQPYKKFFYKWLEAGGVPPVDFQVEGTPSLSRFAREQRGRAGGGVSRPTETPSMPNVRREV